MTPILLLWLVLGAVVVPPSSAAAAAPAKAVAPALESATDDDPLSVRLTDVTPSSVPKRGPVVITGTVRNDSDEVWEQVRVYPVVSAEPIGDSDALAQAADSDPRTTASGSRLTGEGQFIELDRLAPGKRTGFVLRIPRRELPIGTQPGVYWLGAQALGTSPEGRDLLADGRARTFYPLVAPGKRTQVSLIVPIRQGFARDDETRIADPAAAAEQFGPKGRFYRIVSLFGDTNQVSWLLDPAVIDAASDLANDNEPLTLGPKTPATPSPSPTPSSNAGPAPTLDDVGREQAKAWLQAATTAFAAGNGLALPYADADAMGLLRLNSQVLQRAHDVSIGKLNDFGVDATAVIAPPEGNLDPLALANAPSDIRVIGAAASSTTAASASDDAGHQVWQPYLPASEGGPGPGSSTSAFQMRQRILAEAALRADDGGRPLLVQLPTQWDPGPLWAQSRFVDGLSSDWVQLTTPPSPGADDPEAKLVYPKAVRQREVTRDLLDQSTAVLREGTVLADLLETKSNIATRVGAVAFGAMSYAAQRNRPATWARLQSVSDRITELTGRIKVNGTEFVTLSGGSGTVTVSLANDLPQPVKVGLDVRSRRGSGLSFNEIEPVTLAPQQRTTMRLQIRSDRVGVHEVSICPVTKNNEAIGTPLDLTVRSSEVGRWFWSVMVGAALVFVVMIAKRIRERILTHRWRSPDHPDPDGPHLPLRPRGPYG